MDVFEQHRPLLLGLAYRLLGSMWDAEDIVQDAYLRWVGSDRDAVDEPRAFLVTIVSHLALDQLRGARVTREAYVGPWLPEPVESKELGPLDTIALRDTVSMAALHLMERLTPSERAVFVLREAFRYPYQSIAEIIDVPVTTCRQLHHRATKRLRRTESEFHPSKADHERLLEGFLDAAHSGDMDALTALLSQDVVAWNDGGGKVRAARRPIVGLDNVRAFIAGLLEKFRFTDVRIVDANGTPAAWIGDPGLEQLVTIDVHDGRIRAIYAVLNPDKLSRVRPGG
ncbi:MAG TPA: RNA polymerase sigma-70 factor [Stackebrandtia sp.]|uniref:RNA polymerase sigma-70 factor n=1 Tax=Stackebrandtia sp. TaxID=2023065 RepID=UPI002D46FB2B|nr:RNA polymerase sigma-70 factor [Stackebrandtia sp.]HZE38516.1 RNA polymerase sigma-70 factor [Stackebrandtia sp.]